MIVGKVIRQLDKTRMIHRMLERKMDKCWKLMLDRKESSLKMMRMLMMDWHLKVNCMILPRMMNRVSQMNLNQSLLTRRSWFHRVNQGMKLNQMKLMVLNPIIQRSLVQTIVYNLTMMKVLKVRMVLSLMSQDSWGRQQVDSRRRQQLKS